MFMMNIFLLILFFFSLMLILKFYNHLLMILLSIEYYIVMILLNIYYNLNIMEYYVLIFMVMFVIEGVLGISFMVVMIRFFGNDQVKNLMMLMW